MCNVYVRGDNLAGVIITDQDYPSRVSHTLITKILDEFSQRYPASSCSNLTEREVSFPQLNTYLAKYQNPREADAMTKIQDELDETKIILVSRESKYLLLILYLFQNITHNCVSVLSSNDRVIRNNRLLCT